MFKLFKKPPEIPEDMDFLADSPANALDSSTESPSDDDSMGQGMTAGVAAKRAAKESSHRGWPLMLLGFLLFTFVAFGAYWGLKMYYAPVPAELPHGDIIASLTSNPTASPSAPGTSVPIQQPPAQPKPDSQKPQQQAQPQQQPQPQSQQTNPVSPPLSPQPDVKQNQEFKTEQPEAAAFSGIFGSNPFIDLSSLRSLVSASSGGMEMPRFGGTGNMALPDVPRPSVSPDLLPSPGEIQVPSGPAGPGASGPPTMGGIIKSADGSAIAIMGDGTVLSEGDTYKGDRRVTFIGGEGIQFDDGNSIAFGGQHK